mgnify:CR=1 FL=1
MGSKIDMRCFRCRVGVLVPFLVLLSSIAISQDEGPSDGNGLPRSETWTETWLDESGATLPIEVTGEIWTDVFQSRLTREKVLHIPARAKPYYLDGPLVMETGDRIMADPMAEIRLKPGTNTCMVRNKNVVGFAETVVPTETTPDRDIRIEGGIWTTLATGDSAANGNMRGHSSKENYVHGTHGVILLHNVNDVVVSNITIRQSKAFGVHLGNVENFRIDGVRLEGQRRDGVHVNGPARNGVIKNVHGDSHDDTVALNAWEWKNYAPSYGPIRDVLIADVAGAAADTPSANSIRLLPGVKQFSDGTSLDCSISDIVLRNIADINEFKLYEQPNLELGRDKDFSATPGVLRNIQMDGLKFSRPGVIKIAARLEGLSVDNVDLNFPARATFKLIEIGPMSMTWRHGDDPAKWVEVFMPDRDVYVRDVQLGTVRHLGDVLTTDVDAQFIQVQGQKLNPEYPKTTPRGGTGKAIRDK